MRVSIDAEEASDKIQHPFRMETLSELGLELPPSDEKHLREA